jgi:hypothetical protein
MPLLNYTTKKDPDLTASEIAKMLSRAGAKAVLTEYETENGEQFVSALSFKMQVGEAEIGFRLPCDWRPVLKILEADRKVPRSLTDRTQAVRVAWRIVKDWVEAQLALIETQMVKTEQVFLPYAIGRDGKTLYESIIENPGRLLGYDEK